VRWRALEEIEGYTRAARLLTLESPPQHVAFRRWYINALVEQLRAIAAGREPPTPTFEQYLLGTLEVVVAAQRTAQRAARLQRVTAALAEATEPGQVAAVVVSEGVTALGASGGGLLIPEDPQRVTVPGSVGYGDELISQLLQERLDDQLPAVEALRSRRSVWLESRQERDLRYPALAAIEPSAAAMCCLPLLVRDRVLGALRFSFDHPRLFDVDERAFVQALAAQTALFAWRYLPGSAGALVGGDWYDVLALEDGRVALVIGDVMGHGIEAAATMGQLRATARAYVSSRRGPAEVLAELDSALNRLEQGRMTTAAMALARSSRPPADVGFGGSPFAVAHPTARHALLPRGRSRPAAGCRFAGVSRDRDYGRARQHPAVLHRRPGRGPRKPSR
jgi:hypothetical protein